MPVGAVVARNLMDGVTVLSDDIKGSHTVEWGAAGDLDGNDIQYIPEAVLTCVAFQKALARGVVEIVQEESDPMVAEAITRQVESFRRRQDGARAQAESMIDRPEDRSGIMMFCVGPDSRGGGACGQPVAIPAAQKDNMPPLCSNHRKLAPQFIPEITAMDGKTTTVWTRVTLGVRESL